MRLLFIGDIVGRPGRRAVKRGLPVLTEEYGGFDLVLANAENAAGGNGLTGAIAREITEAGVHFMTTGNHVWDQKEFVEEIERVPNIVRPINVPPGTPGRGAAVVRTQRGVAVGILNLGGNLFMRYDNPFVGVKHHLEQLKAEARILVVDFHAEATSEKMAMGWYLDGSVSLLVGTHTHVQTADERVLPEGTAYITDAGMTGPHDSVIGVRTEPVVRRFLTQLPQKFDVARGNVRLSGVVVEIDERTGRARSIERISLPID